MPIAPRPGIEPIPGYQLVERLGSGGFGEVWKATAPGGLAKAIKFVHGGTAGPRAEQERKALERIKEVRHPFLLSLERFEIIDNQLIIVTELADASLFDRFEECRRSGLRGIPRDELLGYIRDAAEVLDYMSETQGLQHLDIKPQNLLLVGRRVKVADFGLVKELAGTSASVTGGVTPVYATPEAFDGRVSRYSDQYSLAIVYMEMLTGVRPFPGTTALQLAAQHSSSPPLLDPLPTADRPVIARALSKMPERRFPTCSEMVRHLLPTAAQAVILPPGVGSSPLLPAATPSSDPHGGQSLFALGTEVGPRITSSEAQTPPEAAGEEPASATLQIRARPTPIDAGAGKAGFRPTLYLGLGGLAGVVLRRLKQRLRERFGTVPAVLRLLLVDTDRLDLRAAGQAGPGTRPGEPLEPEEILLAPLHPPDYYRERAKSLLRWLERRWLYGIPRSLLTEGVRPLGRLALVENVTAVMTRLRNALAVLTSPDARAASQQATGIDLRTEFPRIVVIAASAGGTGGGMLLTASYAARQVLVEQRHLQASVLGFLLHSTSPKLSDKEIARLNTFATLAELNHFGQPHSAYPGDPDLGLAPGEPGQAPLDETYLLHLGDDLDREEALARSVILAEYLYLDAAAAGPVFDQFRESTHAKPEATPTMTLRSFGLDRLHFPRQRLVDEATRLFCQRLAGRWLGELTDSERTRVEGEAQRQVASLGLEEPAMRQRLHAAAQEALGGDPDASFARVTAGSGDPLEPPEPASAILRRVDDLLGAPRASENVTVGKPAVADTLRAGFELAVGGQADRLADEVTPSLRGWLTGQIETPGARWRTATGTARWLEQHLQTVTETLTRRLNQIRQHRDRLRQQLATVALPPPPRTASSSRRPASRPPEPLQPFVDYCKLRMDEVELESALELTAAVVELLSRFNEETEVVRQRLMRFAALCRAPATAPEIATSNVTEFYPGPQPSPRTSATLSAATVWLVDGLGPDRLRAFDELVQAELFTPRGGLWGTLRGPGADDNPAALAESLRREIEAKARPIFLDALQGWDVARLFLDTHGIPTDPTLGSARSQLRDILGAHVRAAFPRLEAPEAWCHLLLAAPSSPGGLALREIIGQALPGVPLNTLTAADDLVLCYEAAHLPLTHVAATIIGSNAGDAEMAERLMTRIDVEWLPLVPQT